MTSSPLRARRNFPCMPTQIGRAARLAVTALAIGGAALAPVSVRAQTAAATTTHNYAITAGPLADALSRFVTVSGVSVAFSPAELSGRRSPGLQGTHEPQPGLALLLQGSGWRALPQARGSFVLQQLPAGAAADQLDRVVVTGNQLGEVTEGSGSYTPGRIATATRLVLSPRETPQTISVTTRQEMDDFNLNSIDQVMAHTPGVNIVTYDSERTEYYARGFAIQNFQYDGIPMLRDSSYSSGNTLTDMAIYDRVEVLKGATGLLTGSGDPGATINLIRKKPTKKRQGHATFGAGSWNSYRGELDLSSGLNQDGSVRGRVVASYQDKESWMDNYQRQTKVFYGVVEADLTPATLLTVGVDYQDSNPRGSTWGGIPLLNSEGKFTNMPRSFNNGANWSRWEQYTRTGFATLQHDFANDWVLKAQFNHQINGYDANLGGAASGNPNAQTGAGVSMWIGQYIGRTTSDALDVYASGPYTLFGRKHELVLGGSVSERQWKNSGWWNLPSYDTSVPNYNTWVGNKPEPTWPATPDYTNDEITRENGLYAASRFNLRDDLKLIAGGRAMNYSRAGLKKNGVFVPYTGVVHDFNKNFSAYASYTTIFKPQAEQDERGRSLDPQEGKNYEIGVKSTHFGGRLNTSVAFFRLNHDNYPEATGGKTPTGGEAYRALKGVKTNGYEVEASGQLSPGWELRAGFNHKVARQQSRKVDTLSPENQFSLYSSYRLGDALAGLTLGGGVRWQDKTWGDVSDPVSGDTVTHVVKGHALVDLSARYEFDRKLSASVSVSNLFDKKYYTIFSWYGTYTWGEPRAVNASVTYKF